MNATTSLPLFPAGERMPVGEDVLWHHRALCRLGLPVRSPGKGAWRREAAGAALQMEASEGTSLPSGRFARLLLIAICDAALRGEGPVAELGETPAALAHRLGLELSSTRLHELSDQLLRLLSSKLSVTWEGSPVLSVFDARGRARVPAEGWRSSVRMTARLRASLEENAVALRRPVLVALSDSPLALDLYAWLAASLPVGETELGASYADLQAQFGQPSQNSTDFAAALEPVLAQLCAAWPELEASPQGERILFRCAAAAPTQALPPEAPPVEASAEVAPVIAEPEEDEPTLPEIEPEDGGELDLEAMLNAEAEARAAGGFPAAVPVPAPEPVAVFAPEPLPEPVPVLEPAAAPESRRSLRQSVSLKSHLTGLPQVIWLQRSNGREIPVIEVTPGGRYDPDLCTVIALEPVALQIWGGLYARDFERVAAWAAANRDLIDDFWEDRVSDFDEIQERVRKVPAPAWR